MTRIVHIEIDLDALRRTPTVVGVCPCCGGPLEGYYNDDRCPVISCPRLVSRWLSPRATAPKEPERRPDSARTSHPAPAVPDAPEGQGRLW